MTTTRTLLAVFLLTMAGCQMAQWRVLQAKIDPKLTEKPAEQIEAERQGAQFIRDKSNAPEVDVVEQLKVIHAVAVPLSSSLGTPEEPKRGVTPHETIKALQRGLMAQQRRTEQWKAFAIKHAGAEIEGTGFNLAGPAGLFAFAAIIALCVLVPPIGYMLLRMLPVLWGFFRKTTNAVAEFAEKRPDAANDLAVTLRGNLDSSHKRLVKSKALKVIHSDA